MPYTSHKASVSLSGVLADVSLTLGRSQCDSCWGGAGGHRHMHVSGCFCLWEGGRKQRLMPLCSTSCSLAFRRSLQPAALAPQSRAAAPGHQLAGGLSPGPGVPPSPWLRLCPQNSTAISVTMQATLLWVPHQLCLLSAVFQSGEDACQLLRCIHYVEATGERLCLLHCNTLVTNKQLLNFLSFFFFLKTVLFIYLFLSWLSFSCHRGTTSAVYKPVSTQHLSKGWRSQDFISDRLRISTGS